MTFSAQIPVIDFAPFLIGDFSSQQQVAQQIQQACRASGFFYLTGHSLSAAQIKQTFAQVKAFFDLPIATKNQVLRSSETNCGYVPLTVEHLNPQQRTDFKEAFNVGIPTPWPAVVPFRQVVEPFYESCIAEVALPLLQALALSLDLPAAFFGERHGQNFILRLLHYPPLPNQQAAQPIRAGAHTDYGTITLLFQEASPAGGLEIHRQGSWMPAPALPETILVNIGDALQRWTNDRYQSTPHRVVLPADHCQSRYSMALFCDPNPDVEIACLSAEPPLYPPLLYRDYLQSRFAATY